MLKIYNTLTKQTEEFKPQNDGKVSFYHCGPTVYWIQHIGNMRSMVLADLIRRSLSYLGYEVRFVRNYTDVGHLTGDNLGDADTGEDRMEKAAKRENQDPQQIADKYIRLFEKHTKLLNVLEPTHKPVASKYVRQMQEMIKVLLEKGYAYATSKAIYFEVDKFPKYNDLNKQDLEKNLEGQGKGDVNDPEKKKPYDFALWFFKTGVHKNALQYWDSPFSSVEVKNGEGIPGWHIECSAMSYELLGETLDIHMGGIEHISIHHTNEIAQSESFSGVKFVNYWMHNEHLLIDGGKMSKSIGNVFSLDDIVEKGFDPIALRYFFLNAHYRSKQNFTWDALQSSSNALTRLKNNVSELIAETKKQGKLITDFQMKFISALENDFNIPEALAVTWETLKSDYPKEDILKTLKEFEKVLGLGLFETKQKEYSDEVLELIKKRKEARESKDWEEADLIRDLLKSKFGVTIQDK